MKKDRTGKTDAGRASRRALQPTKGELSTVIDELCMIKNGPSSARRTNPCGQPLPSREALIEMVEELRAILFPGYHGMSELSEENIYFHLGFFLDKVLATMQEQVLRGLCFVCEDISCAASCRERALSHTKAFLKRLPEIKRILDTDISAAFEGDPAATSPDEAIFCYPGVFAITNYRIAHELYLLGVPLIPRIITEHAHSITGIDIHPGAKIGRNFFIDHGTGVVIGETCIIGDKVRIYQGVTLGAKSFPLDKEGKPIKGIPRHPIVEDDVIIYSGTTILGRVTIGQGSVINGNVWLTRSVPPLSRISQAQSRQEDFEDGGGI
jgi:serine O-acetyltransferase